MKQFAFMGGLPRSGSTLLSSILNQNPEIHSGANSPVCGVMYNVERAIVQSEQFAAYPKPEVIPAVVGGVLDGWYSDIDAEVVIDKSREWINPEYLGTLLRNFEGNPKIIVTVRSIPNVLASFISLIHKNPSTPSFIDQEIEVRQDFNFYRPVDDVRCDHLMRPKGIIDNALFGLTFATSKGGSKYFHIVEYDDLIGDTEETISGIYNFLDVKPFEHDFTNIKNVVPEDDKVYGLAGMHDVRSSISDRGINPEKVLSPYVLNKYQGLEFWRQNEATL